MTDTQNIALIRAEIETSIAQLSPLHLNPLMEKLDHLLDAYRVPVTTENIEKLKNEYLELIGPLFSENEYIDREKEAYPTTSIKVLQDNFSNSLQLSIISAFKRIQLRFSLTDNEKIEIYRGMVLTRYLDARLKKFFVSGEITTPDGAQFQGKGFRSMGQEAIYAAGIRLRRSLSPAHASSDDHSIYSGDFIAPMIRDLGLALCMGQKPYDVLAAQMGKQGKPMNGKDFHIGDFKSGILPPSAPVAISSVTSAGIGLALSGSGRVIVNCSGEGATSSGEWHEAINFAAVKNLPIVFVVQNNQTALSTPVNEQFAAHSIGDKAQGYGIRSITIDGTDPESVFASVTEAADACRIGEGPRIVELICMRFAGHAHHDDMLFFGSEPDQFLEYPEISESGYIEKDKYDYWRGKDPISMYKKNLYSEGLLDDTKNSQIIEEVTSEIEVAAEKVIDAPWPSPEEAGDSPFHTGKRETHKEQLEDRSISDIDHNWYDEKDVGFTSNKEGKTFWEAIVEALAEELSRSEEIFLLGEDIGGKYGNAFVILKPLLEKFGDRMINTPLSESLIIGASVGAALLGKRPIAEIQFNDFVASGFNQLVNNAAKIYYRWKKPVPLTIRMPWGGLRQAGPYHSQNTEPWFYRTPGLKIVCPSTPREAKGLLKSAIRDDNPVLFYEHIALYRASGIKQDLPSEEDDFTIPIGTAHLKHRGNDLTIITYGAFVHRCLSAIQILEDEHGISVNLLDLRSLVPLDTNAVLSTVLRTGKVLIVTEDSKKGSIGQSVASIIAEEIFEYLDAPVRVLGALDTPVPYSPPLEDEFLVSVEQIVAAAKLLADF